MKDIPQKDATILHTLYAYLSGIGRAAIAFSGGVDSAYLLYACTRAGCDIHAYYVQSQFQPAFELADARDICARLGVPLTVLPLDVLHVQAVAQNPLERCYSCKKLIFGSILEACEQDGYTVLMDGTNASDDAGNRPGMRALTELRVLSPLRECGITKVQVRAYSHTAGLPTWDKPAYACLATRIPTGTPIDAATLQRIEHAEDALHRLGFADVRVRVWHNTARIQLPADQFVQAARQREAIHAAIAPYFETVLLDMQHR